MPRIRDYFKWLDNWDTPTECDIEQEKMKQEEEKARRELMDLLPCPICGALHSKDHYLKDEQSWAWTTYPIGGSKYTPSCDTCKDKYRILGLSLLDHSLILAGMPQDPVPMLVDSDDMSISGWVLGTVFQKGKPDVV